MMTPSVKNAAQIKMQEALAEAQNLFAGDNIWSTRGPRRNGVWEVYTNVSFLTIRIIGFDGTLEKVMLYLAGDNDGVRFSDLNALKRWLNLHWAHIGVFIGTIRDI